MPRFLKTIEYACCVKTETARHEGGIAVNINTTFSKQKRGKYSPQGCTSRAYIWILRKMERNTAYGRFTYVWREEEEQIGRNGKEKERGAVNRIGMKINGILLFVIFRLFYGIVGRQVFPITSRRQHSTRTPKHVSSKQRL